MSYGIDAAPSFSEKWRSLPIDVAEWVLDQIELLAKSPVTRSRPTDLPSLQYQLFRFRGIERYQWFEVRFQYAQDEQSIHLIDLVWEELTS